MQIRCPHCGSSNIARIQRGLPVYSEKLKQNLAQGKVILDGCYGSGTDAMYQCNDCKKKFGKEPVCSIRGKKYRPEDLNGIEFNIGGFFGGYDTVDIRNTGSIRAICISHSPEDEDQPPYIRLFQKREWDLLLNTLFSRLFVQEWKRSYQDNDILDGTQWSFKMVFCDGKEHRIYGSNDYPPLWNAFERRFMRYIKEARDKEANPVDILRFQNLFTSNSQIKAWIDEHYWDLLKTIHESEENKRKYDWHETRRTDKSERLNEKHVHSSYLFHCEHCGFEDDIYVGSGFAAPVEFNETVEKVKNGTFGEKWKTMFESHPKTLVNIERTLYVCSSCGHYHSEPNMGLYVLKDGLTEEEIELAGQEPNDKEARYVYLYNMMWSLQYYRKIGNFIHRCPECGKRMHEGGYKDKPKCPKCGKQGNIEEGRILWD